MYGLAFELSRQQGTRLPSGAKARSVMAVARFRKEWRGLGASAACTAPAALFAAALHTSMHCQLEAAGKQARPIMMPIFRSKSSKHLALLPSSGKTGGGWEPLLPALLLMLCLLLPCKTPLPSVLAGWKADLAHSDAQSLSLRIAGSALRKAQGRRAQQACQDAVGGRYGSCSQQAAVHPGRRQTCIHFLVPTTQSSWVAGMSAILHCHVVCNPMEVPPLASA